jgi:hypothetical protein
MLSSRQSASNCAIDVKNRDIFARGGVIHNLASPSRAGPLRSAMNNSELISAA